MILAEWYAQDPASWWAAVVIITYDIAMFSYMAFVTGKEWMQRAKQ